LRRHQIASALGNLHRAKLRLMPLLSGGLIAGGAIAIVSYLLWPTWHQAGATAPSHLPVDVGGTLFNVPAGAFRIKVQAHSGSQDRLDLAFAYPSLGAPEPPRRVSAQTASEPAQFDRLFVTITAHGGSLAPEQRVRTIYPRYLDPVALPTESGLLHRSFRDNSPYDGEDFFYADQPSLSARCTRDQTTPGMCVSERRQGAADIAFRFPRAWLAQWQELTGAMDRITLQLSRGQNGRG
jgi:hypothetical protein